MIVNGRRVAFNGEITDYQNEEKISFHQKILLINYNLCKRLFDIVCGLVGCLCLAPMYLVIKTANILNNDYAPVIYKQQRIGLDGRLFELYKFRTMIPNADKELARILNSNPKLEAEYKLNKKLKNDPRVTKVGKILRKNSLDEFPQFINVLKGDMSFIGNRPYLPREIHDMGSYYNEIIKTKPAITGLWQVNGRSRTKFADRLKLESYYSNNYGIRIDAKIFIKTFRVVLLHQGAE